jgi:hypothetical protein
VLSKLVKQSVIRDNHTMRTPVALLGILLIAGCSARVDDEISDPGRTIVPQGGNGIVLASEAVSGVDITDANGTPDLRVQLPEEYLPSQAFTINLDLDDSDEQIIVYKRRDDPAGLIGVLIVSYDPVRSNWIRAWEGFTQATNVRSFTLYTDDLVGDHEQEIVCFGINNDGEQTLDVFRRTRNSIGLGLSYGPILSVAADVNIRIEEIERSEAFEAMEAISGESYPVLVEQRDPEASSAFDTIQTAYMWDFSAGTYVPAFTERVSGESLQDSQLRALFEGTEADFEQFLSGPWYRTASSPEEMEIVFFGTQERTIVFHSRHLHLQQAFVWNDSAKTVYGRGVQIFVTNEILRSLKRLISVTVSDLNSINLVIQESDRLNGTYERLTGSLQAAVLSSSGSGARLAEFQPRGLYTSDTGVEIVFGDPDFTYRDFSGLRKGGYVVYTLGTDTILELKFVDENRLPVESRRYGLRLEESQDEDRLVRSINLQPGYVGIVGFAPSGDPPLTLEQIELSEES